MSTADQAKEIERILREIFTSVDYVNGNVLYYKFKGRNINYTQFDRLTYYPDTEFLRSSNPELRKLILDYILSNPRLEYALYINDYSRIIPSQYCIRQEWPPNYRGIISQFFPEFYIGWSKLLDIISALYDPVFRTFRYVLGTKDPLTQILLYPNVTSKYALYRMYACESVTVVEPYICKQCKKYPSELQDPTSIFHGRYGIIAYCASLRNIMFADIFEIKPFELLLSIEGLSSDIQAELANLLGNNSELEALHKKDPVKACDIDLILKYMQSEIEKNESLKKKIEELNSRLRRYGFIRVAFPLD